MRPTDGEATLKIVNPPIGPQSEATLKRWWNR